MYTKNPVTGKNETLVNTSMLKGAVDGVLTKIADKADQEAFEGLSVYTEGVRTSIAGKADKADVEEVSAYAEGLLPKDVYGTMVDAYVGLACKVADPDVLEGAAKMAYAANPVKYATSNPSDNGCAEVTDRGSTIYTAIHAAGSTVELPPFLRLKSWGLGIVSVGDDVTSWKTSLPNLTDGNHMFYRCSGLTSWMTELPNLTNGSQMFGYTGLTTWNIELPNLTSGQMMFQYCLGLTTWNIELPNLTDGSGMFYRCSDLTSWTVELPNLTNGQQMFQRCSGLTQWTVELPNLTDGTEMFNDCSRLTNWIVELPNLTNGEFMFEYTSIEEWTVELPSLTNGSQMFTNGSFYNPDTPAALKRFRGTLPALVKGDYMFTNCPLDLESIRCISESINDVNDLTEDSEVTKILDICVGYDIETEPLHDVYLTNIRDKGWRVTVNGIQQ